MTQPIAPEKRHALYTQHEAMLNAATEAIHRRHFYAAYPEPPSGRIYGETANEDGLARYNGQLNNDYEGLRQEADTAVASGEVSPYTHESLGMSYPSFHHKELYIRKATEAWEGWRKADPYTRAGILVDSLERIKARFFELAYATMHTTGQAFVMSFQASGPHSNDRALEAIAMGLYEQTRFPSEVQWTKPMGKFDVNLRKEYKAVPLGVGLAIGCSTFPVWNTSPGIYASLITGNPVIVKPHPKVVYPLAIVVEEIQRALQENGFDPHIVQLAVDTEEAPITKQLAEDPAVKIIDYTGSSRFGNWLGELPGKRLFTEMEGINSIVLDSVADLKMVMQNIAFSLSLYSGQMCTCPQNIFIPMGGITVAGEKLSYDETVAALAHAISGLVNHEKMGPGTLGAIQSEMTKERIGTTQDLGYKVVLESSQVANPEFPNARIATPSLIEVPYDKLGEVEQEFFGPIAFVIPVEDARQGTDIARRLAEQYGAITFSAYTLDPALQDYMVDQMSLAYTGVSFNFTGPIWVNQSAGFSDFHVSGGNPAGNASLVDPEYVTRRFEWIGVRKM